MNTELLLNLLRNRLPELMAVYAFGSQVQGTANAESDWDLAVLVPGYADPLALWELTAPLSEQLGSPVDLLDLRAASAVMQYQILTQGQRLWAQEDAQANWFEAIALNEKLRLDTARAGLLEDIQKRGSIYG